MKQKIRISNSVPMPVETRGRQRKKAAAMIIAEGLTQAMRYLEVGQSFLYRAAQSNLHNTATRIGIAIRTMKLPDGRVRIWRAA